MPRAPSNGGSGVADSTAFNSHLESRRSYETETASRIVSLLEPICGIGHVRADVSADLDFNQVEQTEEKYDPKSAVIRSQQAAQETRNSTSTQLSGIAGTRSNDPARPTTAGTQPAQTVTPAGDGRTATTTNYEIDKTVTHTTGGGGRITRLSVSVVTDYKNVNGVAVNRTPEELQKMQGLVAAAVGIDPAKIDQVVVQSIPFDQPALESRVIGWQEKYKEFIQTGLKYGLLLLAALLVIVANVFALVHAAIVFVIRPARKQLRNINGQLELAGAGMTNEFRALTSGNEGQPGVTGPQNLRRADPPQTVAEIEAQMDADIAREIASFIPEVKRASAVKKQLIERTHSSPETLAMTVRGWLQDQ